MRVVVDIEADGLKPTKIHCIVCRDIDTDEVTIFRPATNGPEAFLSFAQNVSVWIGHNALGYDAPVLARLLGFTIPLSAWVDTLVVSKLLNGDNAFGHSLDHWGKRLGFHKLGADITDWSQWTQLMEDRCVSDTRITALLFKKWEKYLTSERWKPALKTEHFIAYHCQETLHKNGFAFDLDEAHKLRDIIASEVSKLDETLLAAFPPRTKFLREYTPKETKFGTISLTSIPRGSRDCTGYSVGAPFSTFEYVPFNPGSPKQIVERLNEAGWHPTEKTKGHREAEQTLRQLSRKRRKSSADLLEIKSIQDRLEDYRLVGWSISEENLSTLPDSAPKAAHSLARRLLLSNRVSTLNSWIAVCRDGKIYGSFNHIGAWTGRMSHDRPNMGNIPRFDAKQPHKTPYSDKMRSLWLSSPARYLVGVDAESIQLRILAHYIDDKEFTQSLISGDKKLGTDPHSVNQRALGYVCKSRDDAKTFIYAWLLGAAALKVSQILGCTLAEAREAVENFIRRYSGLQYLKDEIIPFDAERGFFEGFDGRFVKIWGDEVSLRTHLCLAGYLQNGESVIMKRAAQIWVPKLEREGVPFWWVNLVHDEFQTETPEDVEIAQYVARTQAAAIAQVGDDLKLRCPMAGSYLSDHGLKIGDVRWAIGKNWMQTH